MNEGIPQRIALTDAGRVDLVEIPWDQLLVTALDDDNSSDTHGSGTEDDVHSKVAAPTLRSLKRKDRVTSAWHRPPSRRATRLPSIPEFSKVAPPPCLSATGFIKGRTLVFTFDTGDLPLPTALDKFASSFTDTIQGIDLLLASGVPYPPDFLAKLTATAQAGLARCRYVTLRLEGAAQRQNSWAWPSGNLERLRLEGVARGGAFPLAQLVELEITPNLKAANTAAFLKHLPRLRIISLSLGSPGYADLQEPTILLSLEELVLRATTDTAMFFDGIRLPALRKLGAYLHIAASSDDVLFLEGLRLSEIQWDRLEEAKISGPSVGPKTFYLLHQLLFRDGNVVLAQCCLQRPSLSDT
ncbi:hypothetical protein BD626DRAFT_573812 [Schizophyllum amplum]|uniref:Uncharacterized protein n=1 Tax=Schizophyllum amplum TaxID=97359 RepID=A0A550C051_9AGAR|nr:hypothetical protein BD626DRAFT_573812 [Auriculariopsis ampla]